MYNWSIVREYYIADAEKYGPGIMENDDFAAFYMQNLPAIMKITGRIAKSPIWDGMQIKNIGRANLIDMVASLFMGMSVPIVGKNKIDFSISSIKRTIEMFANLDDGELSAMLSETMQSIIQNLNDVLGEFQTVVSHSSDMHYLEIVKIMYLTGLFMGNAFVNADSHPEGTVESSNNMFAAYIVFLKESFEDLERRSNEE